MLRSSRKVRGQCQGRATKTGIKKEKKCPGQVLKARVKSHRSGSQSRHKAAVQPQNPRSKDEVHGHGQAAKVGIDLAWVHSLFCRGGGGVEEEGGTEWVSGRPSK